MIRNTKDLINVIPSEMLRIITHELTKTDILIIGDNDFDYSFFLAGICSLLQIPFVLTFKETRYRENDLIEKLAIEGAMKVVIPHKGYIEFFKKKHNIDISKKAVFADVDWRSRFVYEQYIRSKKVQKLSQKDNRIHVCILASRAIWDKNETRSQGRYYYLDIIEDLLKASFVVHLHTKAIIKSLDEPVVIKDNPYTMLAKKYRGQFLIEKPIDLRFPEGYYELMKYDLGLLTSGKRGDPFFMEFEQYNIPNRYYEYKMAGVIPIAPKGILKYMEEEFDDVLFFEKPEDIYSHPLLNRKSENTRFYKDLISEILDSVF
jgi:hypothetical protein